MLEKIFSTMMKLNNNNKQLPRITGPLFFFGKERPDVLFEKITTFFFPFR